MGIDIDFDNMFFAQPFQTDDLKARLEALREDMRNLQGDFQDKENALLDLARELETMEAKTDFVIAVMRETASLFTPPPPEGLEVAYDGAKALAYDRMQLIEGLVGGAGGALYLMGKLGPGSVKLAAKLGQIAASTSAAAPAAAGAGLGASGGASRGLGAGSSSTKFVRGARAAKTAKLSKAMKFTKVGKGMMGVSAVIMAVEIGMKLSSAKEINEHLRREQKTIERHIKIARAELKKFDSAIAERRALQKDLFDDAGVHDVSAYVRYLNESIADIGRRKAHFSMARRMLKLGLAKAMVLATIDDLDEAGLDDIARRLDAETRLAAGETVEATAQALGLDLSQVEGVYAQVLARGALIEGAGVGETAFAFGLSEDVVEGERESLLDEIDDVWAAIEGAGPLDAAAAALTAPVESLAALRRELAAKSKLEAGQAASALAAEYDLSLDVIKAWAGDLAEARIDAGERIKSGAKPLEVAAALRLPGGIVDQMAA